MKDDHSAHRCEQTLLNLPHHMTLSKIRGKMSGAWGKISWKIQLVWQILSVCMKVNRIENRAKQKTMPWTWERY